MNNKGQISVEYMLLLSIIIVILVITANTILEENSKNTILTSAQIGAQIGVDKNAYAMYYNDTFNNYQSNYPKLINPTEIKVIMINMSETNNELELQVVLHSNTYLNSNEKNAVGSRVNYYVRKSISETFGIQNHDLYYENIKINKYEINTKTVKWV